MRSRRAYLECMLMVHFWLDMLREARLEERDTYIERARHWLSSARAIRRAAL